MKKARSLTVALTGGIGAGKSEALKGFRAAGAATLSLDTLARRLSSRGAAGFRLIVSAFGTEILDASGEIDRSALGRRVFSDPAQRRKLEKILHPLILKEMRRWVRKAAGDVKIVEVPLLFETKLENEFDATMTVEAPMARRRRRARRRGYGFSERALAQLSDSERRGRADVVLTNEGSRAELRRKVTEYQKAFRLISSAGGRNG